MVWFVLFLLVVIIFWAAYVYITKARRRALRRIAIATPFPEEWIQILHRNIPLYTKLPLEQQQELQEGIQVFLAEKLFEGSGGISITD